MIFPYLPRFQTWPLWERLAVPLGFTMAFVVVFYVLYPLVGGVAIILSFVPVAVVSWTMGKRAGIVSGVLAVLGNYLLLVLAGEDANAVIVRGALSSLTLVLLGGLAGWVSQLVEKLRSSAAQLEQEREILQQEMAIRMHKERDLKAALTEKEVLLKEIHHRVKNNLQIISSLLSLQSSKLHDSAALTQFQDSQNRIRTMALIHERLYRSDDLGHIDFAPYLSGLTGHLLASYEAQQSGVTIKVEADDISLDIDTAIPCGLIINELISNALKHAFPNGNRGTICVEMHAIDQAQYRLIVRDDGLGFPADMNLQKTNSLGLQLVRSLTRQLGGTVEFSGPPGTQVVIQFLARGTRAAGQREYQS